MATQLVDTITTSTSLFSSKDLPCPSVVCVLSAAAAAVAQVQTGGGDAFFTTAAGRGALGIADGASSQHEDAPAVAGSYAHTLLSHCAEAFDNAAAAAATAVVPDPAAHDSITGSNTAAAVIPYPADVLAAAQLSTEQQPNVPLLLAAMQPDDKLHILTNGDCRILLLRGGCVVAETEGQLQDAER
jgi:serine/threonine protein phosphatase PrpC